MSAAIVIAPDLHKDLLVIERLAAALATAASVDEIKDVRDRAMAIQLYTRKKAGGLAAAQSAGRVVTDATVMLLKLYEAEKLPTGAPRSSYANGSESLPLGKHAMAKILGHSRGTLKDWRPLGTETPARIEVAKQAIEARGDIATPSYVCRELTSVSSGADYDGDEWYTPANVIALVRKVLGSIDLDAASNPHAQKTVKAKKYFSKQDDALGQEWHGRVFCNPPYSTALVKGFTEHLLEEVDAGRVTAAIYLVNNCTDAGWFHSLAKRFPFCLTRGRLPFTNAAGVAFPTRQGQAIFYTGENTASFAQIFGDMGIVVGRID